MVWLVRLTGIPELRHRQSAVAPRPLARKDAGWLACAALSPGTSSLQVAGWLWPQSNERGALNNLRQRLFRLRQATGARLVEMSDSLHLAADLALDDPAPQAALEADPAAWDADWLAGLAFDGEGEFAAWLQAVRRLRAQTRAQALVRVAEAAERAGEIARALRYAQRLLADEPLSEHAHRRLMRLHYLRGDSAAAVAAFEACETQLKDQLGLRPGAETQDLLHTVQLMRPARRAAVAPLPACLRRPPRTVGREGSWARMNQAWVDGDAVVLTGEAGIGKSRLLQDFGAAQGEHVYVQARMGDAAAPYGLLLRLLQTLVTADAGALVNEPALAAWMARPGQAPDGREPAPAARAWAAALARCLSPGLREGHSALLMDDLHFADAASLELLEALLLWHRPPGLRCLMAHRPPGSDTDADSALRLQSIDEMDGVCRITLEPLGPEQLGDLLADLSLPNLEGRLEIPSDDAHSGPDDRPIHRPVDNPVDAPTEAFNADPNRIPNGGSNVGPEARRSGGQNADPTAGRKNLAQALAQHTGGNPLFVLETLRALLGAHRNGPRSVSALPRSETIERLIDSRLRRLTPPALQLLRVAAIASPDFSPDLAEVVLGQPALSLADAWRELEDADILRGCAFAHDLVHDAALRATPAAIAGHEHGRVAGYLQNKGAEPARVAAHWQAAAQWPQAASAYEQAAQRALGASRLREQAGLLQQALRCHLAAGDVEAAAHQGAKAVEALLISTGPDAARACADALLLQVPPGAGSARLLVARAGVHYMSGHMPAAADDARAALAALGDRSGEGSGPGNGDASLVLAAQRRLAVSLTLSGRVQQALDLLEPWTARPRETLTATDWMEFHGDLTNVLMSAGRFNDARLSAERHLDLARALGAKGERLTGLINLSSMKALQGDMASGIAMATEADAELPEAGVQLQSFRDINRVNLGAMLALSGNFDPALGLLQRCCDELARQPAARHLHANAQNVLARTLVTLGQPARAHALLAGDVTGLPDRAGPSRLAAQAVLAQALGKDAAPLLHQARALATARGGPVHERLMLALDLLPFEPDDDRRLAASCALKHEAEECGFLGVAAAAGIERMANLLRLQRLDEVGSLLPEAEQAAWRWRRAYLPGLLRVCIEAHAALGRRAQAQACLESALDWVHATALPTVPMLWRDGFLHRNPHNRALAALAARA